MMSSTDLIENVTLSPPYKVMSRYHQPIW